MNQNKKALINKCLFWGTALAISIMSVTPQHTRSNILISPDLFRIDYLIHTIAFASLALAFLWVKFPDNKIRFRTNELFQIFSLVLFAYGSEYIQHYVKGRTYNINDFYFNLLGLLTGFTFGIISKRLKTIV